MSITLSAGEEEEGVLGSDEDLELVVNNEVEY